MQNKIKICKIVLLCLSVLTIGCSKDSYNIQETQKDKSTIVSQRTIRGTEALAIGQKLSSTLNSMAGKAATNYGTIDYSEIKNVINDNGKENYTFRINNHPESSEKVFFNLVMTQREGYTTVMLMKYEMDAAFAEAYYTQGKGFVQFSGTVTTSLISSNDPCPPVVVPPVHIPSGGGGGGTTPAPDTSPDQGSGSGLPSIPVFTILDAGDNDDDSSGTGTGTGTSPGTTTVSTGTNGCHCAPQGSNFKVRTNTVNDTKDPCPKDNTAGILSPEAQESFYNFRAALPDDQENWLIKENNHTIRTLLFNYLFDHNFDDESKAFATEMIDYAYNNNSPGAVQEIINIMDIMNDGKINGEYVVVSPNVPITNMSDYLSCFNTSQAATITIYADQPIANQHSLYGEDGVGHAFISIKQGTKVKTLGFYPISGPASIVPNLFTLQPKDFLSTAGIFGNDQGHPYDVSLSLPLTSAGLANVINSIVTVANSNPQYNIGSMNCTDLAISIFNSETIMNIPNCEAPSPWNGQTPGTLGEVIRNLDVPVGTGGVKNTNGGNAPINNSN